MDPEIQSCLAVALKYVEAGRSLEAAPYLDQAAARARALGNLEQARDYEDLARWAREDGGEPRPLPRTPRGPGPQARDSMDW